MTQKSSKRFDALDVFRGLTIVLMIIVNNPGNWEHVYSPLMHATWNGLTPTDCVFPCFLFVMGFSIYLSLHKRGYKLDIYLAARIMKRFILLFGIGLLINLSFSRSFADLRIMGVLQRFAICYAVVAILACKVKRKFFPLIAAIILILYTVLLLMGKGFEYGTDNILSRFDISVLGINHIYNDNGIEPEGLLSTLPAIAHTMIGFSVARSCQRHHSSLGKIFKLMIPGAAMILAGVILSYVCPINKKVWSPTFVLTTCGISCCILGLLVYVIEHKRRFRNSTFLKVFGTNAILCYILAFLISFGSSHICIKDYNIHYYIQCLLTTVFSDGCLASLIYPLLMIGVIFSITYPLYKKRIYIRL